MRNLKANSPIGIFDSGVGGLTVVKEILNVLPNESIIYFGDTAHLPYGDKSDYIVYGYAKKIVDFFLEKGCKLILMACNSASSVAYDGLKEYVGNKAFLINVIDPIANFIGKNYSGGKTGLIGTKLTVQSEIYNKKLLGVDLCSLATPLIVPIIEEGLFDQELMAITLEKYLSDNKLKGIEKLILGCTHYPIIKKNIEKFYKGKVEVFDTPNIVSNEVKDTLVLENLLASSVPEHDFYVSDLNDNFVEMAEMFFGKRVVVKEGVVF